MARNTTFTRDDVIRAAMTVLEAEGVQAVTARRVADAMGASTAPVYSNYANMDELLTTLLGRACERVLEYCRRPWCDDGFMNMGLGYVRFAIDFPQLFRALYLDAGVNERHDHRVHGELLADLGRHPVLGALPDDHKSELLFQASVYTLGIATTVVTGMWADPDLDVVENWMHTVGGALCRAALESAGLPLPPEMEHQRGEFVVPWRHPGCPGGEDANHE